MTVFARLPFGVRYVPPVKREIWIVLIHGMGVTERSWTDPYSESMVGGFLPFDYVLTDLNRPPDSLNKGHPVFGSFCLSTPLRMLPSRPSGFWDLLSKAGYGLVTWTQRDSLGPLARGVEELGEILECFSSGDRVVLLGHSRGGLIARKFLQEDGSGSGKVKAVVLLGTPNRGSQIADLARIPRQLFLQPGFRIFSGRFGAWGSILGRVVDYIRSSLEKPAVRELCPGSPLMVEMKAGELEEGRSGVPYFNFAGTGTTYVRLYQVLSREPLRTVQVFSILDGMENFLRAFWPPELQQGRGDGLVSTEKAFLPFARENRQFHVNHAQFLVHGAIQRRVLDILQDLK